QVDELFPRLELGEKARTDLGTLIGLFVRQLKRVNMNSAETALRVAELERLRTKGTGLEQRLSPTVDLNNGSVENNNDFVGDATPKPGSGDINETTDAAENASTSEQRPTYSEEACKEADVQIRSYSENGSAGQHPVCSQRPQWALSACSARGAGCLLSEVKQPSVGRSEMSASDPKRTFANFWSDAQLRLNNVIVCAEAVQEGGSNLLVARRLSAAVTALLLIAGAFLVLLFPITGTRAESTLSGCEDAAGITVLPAPIAPWKGAPLRVLVVAERPLEGELSLIGPNGDVLAKSRERQGGPPYYWYTEVGAPAPGMWRATFTRERAVSGCITRDVVVSAQKPA